VAQPALEDAPRIATEDAIMAARRDKRVRTRLLDHFGAGVRIAICRQFLERPRQDSNLRPTD
jgi:hypothetical protein